jgi:lipoprotein NlpD
VAPGEVGQAGPALPALARQSAAGSAGAAGASLPLVASARQRAVEPASGLASGPAQPPPDTAMAADATPPPAAAAALHAAAQAARQVQAAPVTPVARALGERAEVLRQVEAGLRDKRAWRRAEIVARVRGLYKTLEGGRLRLWFDAPERQQRLRRRVIVPYVLDRELDELVLLDQEIASVRGAVGALATDRLLAAVHHRAGVGAPERHSFERPVQGAVIDGFGPYTHGSGAQLIRRGITLAAAPGEPVRACGDGRVRYVGPLRGAGLAVVTSHPEGVFAVTAGLGRTLVSAGQEVQRAQPIGEPGAGPIYFELRLDHTAGGFPVDPEPLLAPRSRQHSGDSR